jgi:hypothetical protein
MTVWYDRLAAKWFARIRMEEQPNLSQNLPAARLHEHPMELAKPCVPNTRTILLLPSLREVLAKHARASSNQLLPPTIRKAKNGLYQ